MCKEAEVYAVQLSEGLEDDKFKGLMNAVSSEKQKKADKLRNIKDAQRMLIGDVLIRSIICNKLKIRNSELVFDKNEYGKPFLPDYPDFYYNISHSGDWVVCCIGSLPVGIDIEMIKPIDLKIAKRFFSQREYESIKAMDASQRQSYFFELWSLKESYIKAIGMGMFTSLASFTIIKENDDIKVLTVNGTEEYYFKQFNIDANYKMAVCSAGKYISDDVKIIELEEICEKALQII